MCMSLFFAEIVSLALSCSVLSMSGGAFTDLLNPNARFDVLEELGVGSYGRVFRALDKKQENLLFETKRGLKTFFLSRNQRIVAVKAMSLESDEDGVTIDRAAMTREVEMMVKFLRFC
jgi:serine/threonine protein kinase